MKTFFCLVILVASIYFCSRLAKTTYKNYKCLKQNHTNGIKYTIEHYKSEFFLDLTGFFSFLITSIALALKLLDTLITFIDINPYVYSLLFGIFYLIAFVLSFFGFKYHFKEMIKRKRILLLLLIVLGEIFLISYSITLIYPAVSNLFLPH